MRLIGSEDVERLFTTNRAFDAMRRAARIISEGSAELPLRQYVNVPGGAGGKLAIMPGALGNPPCFGIKLVGKFPRAAADPLGSHVGMVLLFDSRTGMPAAMIEGSSLTAICTAAASAVATDLLARPQAQHLAILGTGEQARRHAVAMAAVRSLTQITVWGRTNAKAEALATFCHERTGVQTDIADTPAAAVEHAGIICTTTASERPLLAGADLPRGAHVNLVGAAVPTSAEVDAAAVARSQYFVDHRPSALAAAGELHNAIGADLVDEGHILGELGQVLGGDIPGRRRAEDITMYKSLGSAVQDLVAADAIFRLAEAEGAGHQWNAGQGEQFPD